MDIHYGILERDFILKTAYMLHKLTKLENGSAF